MELRHRQENRLLQRQELRLTHQLIQKLELLHLPTLELEQLINEELEQNPLLEIQESQSTTGEYQAVQDLKESHTKSEERDELQLLNRLEDDKASRSLKTSANQVRGDSDKYQEILQNLPGYDISLVEHLKTQLGIMDLPPEVRMICEYIIESIDDDGYLKCSLGDLADQMGEDGELKNDNKEQRITKIEYALCNIIQKLDPPGVGARTLKECLLLQIAEDAPHFKIKQKLVSYYLDDLMHNRIPHVVKQLLNDEGFLTAYNLKSYNNSEAMAVVNQIKEELKVINPFPGIVYSARKSNTVRPDIIVKEITPGKHEIILSDDFIPNVFINDNYVRLLRDKSTSKEQKEFIKKKILNAKALIDAIGFRRWFLLKLAHYVIDFQKDFLEDGIQHLKPLKMKDLASKFEVNISTISRAVNEKYIQTPHGIFPLKFFFATAATKSSNTNYVIQSSDATGSKSRMSIKDKINTIISQESKDNPLDDSEVSKILEQEYGIKSARRTIAKYRSELNIPSAKLRKVFH